MHLNRCLLRYAKGSIHAQDLSMERCLNFSKSLPITLDIALTLQLILIKLSRRRLIRQRWLKPRRHLVCHLLPRPSEALFGVHLTEAQQQAIGHTQDPCIAVLPRAQNVEWPRALAKAALHNASTTLRRHSLSSSRQRQGWQPTRSCWRVVWGPSIATPRVLLMHKVTMQPAPT